jgi:acyl-CoA thioester hydrolase
MPALPPPRITTSKLRFHVSRLLQKPGRREWHTPGSRTIVCNMSRPVAEWARYGVEPGWSFAIPHRVRWSECDPFGHANHRAYFEWFEEARNRYLEAVGLAPLSPDTPGPVIAETSIRYHRPLVYADEILVTARTVRLGRTSFEMEYAVWRDGLCAHGRAVLILVINGTGEKTPLPPELRERILVRDPNAQGRGPA